MAACDLEEKKKKSHSAHTHLYQRLLVSLCRFQERERERKEEGVKENRGGGGWECKREKKRYSKGDGGSEARERDGNERQGGPER